MEVPDIATDGRERPPCERTTERGFPVGELLRLAHQQSSNEPIRCADENGVFPGHMFPAAPVVPDANELRGDVLYACRNQRRTVLVNAANAGAIRLYCAEHVIAEVEEHAAEWTLGGPVTTEQFLDCWRSNYLPLMRVVAVPDGLLHPDEAERIELLRKVDPDDVPSATLALLLEAFYLSKDWRAVRAVYGADHDLEAHKKWLAVLVACGDAGELGDLFHSAVMLAGISGRGLVHATRRLAADAPWLAVPLALPFAYLLARWTPDHTRRLRDGMSTALRALGDLAVEQHRSRTRFLAALPAIPDWSILSRDIDPTLVLARSCLHVLARSPRVDQSAADLAPALPVPSGEAKVRATLRGHQCFTEVYYGRFQLGTACG